jgi:sugar O-acyltransferase (sialic acid O-acetyltransferase NeuD family)
MIRQSVWNGLPIVIFGTGGISIETFNLIRKVNLSSSLKIFDFLGFVEDKIELVGKKVLNQTIVTCDDEFSRFCSNYLLIGVIVPNGIPKVKKRIVEKILFLNIPNIVFPNVIHPSLNIDDSAVKLGQGNIITEGVKLTCEVEIGNFNLINLNSTIGHHVLINDYCVINPLVSLSGHVTLQGENLIGTGANILENKTIGLSSIVGAGALVSKDIEENVTVVGIPAKKIKDY